MRIVLFGKNGQLGWEFQNILPIFGEVFSIGRDDLDLSNLNALRNILGELRPNLIINAAAYTQVDLAETQVELAMSINALVPAVMAEFARKSSAAFIHYSTDYVFDGKGDTPYIETDPTNPLNVYGKSKLMGEENIKQAGDAYLIFRTSWVYSMRGDSFVNKALAWARKNETLKIVSDQISSPTWARMLAEITCRVLAKTDDNFLENIRERRGIYHVSGSGYTSRYEWAKEILANDLNRTEQVVRAIEPARTEDFPTPAVRPLFSVLDCARFESTFALQLPDWNSTLKTAMTK